MSDATPVAAEVQGRGARRRWAGAAALLLFGTGIALLAGWWLRRVPAPPALDLAGVDPAIVQAIDKARTEVRSAPRSAAAWGRLGMVLRAHDFAAESNVCFAQAERLDATDPRWPYLHGLTVALTDRDAGVSLLERAADRCFSNPAPRLRLAEVLILQGRLDEAERHIRMVAAAGTAEVRAQLDLARIAERRGNWQQALTHLERPAASPLARKAALAMRAEVHEQLGAVEQASADQAQAALQPDDPPWPDPMVEEVEMLKVGVEAQLALAEQRFRQGRASEALALLDETARAAPQLDTVFLALGHTLLRVNEPARAERALRHAVELAPAAAEAQFQLGNALFLQQRVASASAAFRAAICSNPAHALAHYNLGHCLLKQGDQPGAIAAFRETLRYRPNYADAHTNLGDLLAQAGKDSEAIEHLEHAVRLAPADERARKLLTAVRSRPRRPGS